MFLKSETNKKVLFKFNTFEMEYNLCW